MKILRKFMIVLLVVLTQFIFISPQIANAATAPDLGVADSYAIWGKAGVTNDVDGTTHIWGNVGADLLTSITNLLSSQVDGAIIAPTEATVQTAISDAYTFLSTPPQDAPQQSLVWLGPLQSHQESIQFRQRRP